MRPISLRHRRFSLLLLAAVMACGSESTLAPPVFDNVVDTTVLYGLTGTPIGTPSAFDVVQAVTVRTDLNKAFDFAVEIAGAADVDLLPAGALGFAADPGVLLSARSFDAITSAPTDGYVQDSVVPATVGSVFVLRSRTTSELCGAGSLPRYGKFRVLAIDAATRSVTLEFLVNQNCGYRSLEPGLPNS